MSMQTVRKESDETGRIKTGLNGSCATFQIRADSLAPDRLHRRKAVGSSQRALKARWPKALGVHHLYKSRQKYPIVPFLAF